MLKQIVSNGCSWMWGMGVSGTDVTKLGVDLKLGYTPAGGRQENRLSGLFADKYNAHDINLSIPGGSNDRILRTVTEWLFHNQSRTLRSHKSRYLSETFVLVGLTQLARSEVWYHKDPPPTHHSKWVKINGPDYRLDRKTNSQFNKYIDLKFQYFHSYQGDYERTLRNIIQLASVCEYYGCKYLIFDALASLDIWSLNGYSKDTEYYFNSKHDKHDYLHPNFGTYGFPTDVVESKNEFDPLSITGGQDRHYDYNKRSLEDIIKSNPNIYLDTTWDQFLGGCNSRFRHSAEKHMKFPKGWKWFGHDELNSTNLDDKIHNKDGLYAYKDMGHPSAKGNYMWFKHLEEYIEKNKLFYYPK